MYSLLRFLKRNNSKSEPIIIDAEKDLERDAVTGRMVYKTPSLKMKLILALQLLGGIVLGISLFLILLPIAILLAIAVLTFLLMFLLFFWWRFHKLRAFWSLHRRF